MSYGKMVVWREDGAKNGWVTNCGEYYIRETEERKVGERERKKAVRQAPQWQRRFTVEMLRNLACRLQQGSPPHTPRKIVLSNCE